MHYVQETTFPPMEGDGVGGLSDTVCVVGGYASEDAEETHGKHHFDDVNSGALQSAQYGVHLLEEVVDEPIDICDHGCFQIILKEPMDPHVTLNSMRTWKGESSSMRERFILKRVQRVELEVQVGYTFYFSVFN